MTALMCLERLDRQKAEAVSITAVFIPAASPSCCFRAASSGLTCASAPWLHSWRSPGAVLPRLLPNVSFRQFCLGDETSLEPLPATSCTSYDMLRGIVKQDKLTFIPLLCRFDATQHARSTPWQRQRRLRRAIATWLCHCFSPPNPICRVFERRRSAPKSRFHPVLPQRYLKLGPRTPPDD